MSTWRPPRLTPLHRGPVDCLMPDATIYALWARWRASWLACALAARETPSMTATDMYEAVTPEVAPIDRERFRRAVMFDPPDRVPLVPGHPRESTLAVWRGQGLPENASWEDCLWSTLGIGSSPARGPTDSGVSFRMVPTFEEKVLAHRNGHYIVQDWMGAITEISDEYDYTYIRSAKDFVTRRWHRFPVRNRREWIRNIAWRYDPGDPERYAPDIDDRCQALRSRQHVWGLTINGPFWQLREWCGLANLCLLMIDEPTFVREMIDCWTQFVLVTLDRLLELAVPDYVVISEDMAYKIHSMISPAMARSFLAPTWRRWVDDIRDAGCPIVAIDCDGYIGELLPVWIEAGFNCCTPVEVAAGNDIVSYRRKYGERMAYLGGIDKRALAVGGKKMRCEVERVVPPLLVSGGFIPSCDHGVPPDISWPDFVEYARLLAQLTGWL